MCARYSLVKIKSIPDWHLFISRMETKWTKWYAMTSHVIAYRLLELLFGTHTFHFNCFFDDFNCAFTQIRCLSRVLSMVVRFSLLTAYRTLWYWAVYISVIVVNQVINLKCYGTRCGRHETIIFGKFRHFYVRYLYTLSSFIFLFHIICQNLLKTTQFPN